MFCNNFALVQKLYNDERGRENDGLTISDLRRLTELFTQVPKNDLERKIVADFQK